MGYIKYTVLVLFSLCFALETHGQSTPKTSYFGKVLYIGAGVSIIPNVNGDNAKIEPVANEFTYIANVAIDVSKHWAVGLEGRKIYYNVLNRNIKQYLSKEQYYQVGGFIQYFIRPVSFNRSFVELGAFNSNYCSCGRGFSYLKTGSVYATLALSTEWRIYRNLFFELGITFQRLLNPPVMEIGGLNTPIWGLTYQFQ